MKIFKDIEICQTYFNLEIKYKNDDTETGCYLAFKNLLKTKGIKQKEIA